jgi:hypothetical protein
MLNTIESIVPIAMLYALASIVGLILLDWLIGVCAAVKQEKFDVRKLPQFIPSNIVPYIGGLLVLAIAALIVTSFAPVFYAAAAAVAAKFVTDIKDKAIVIFGKTVIEAAASSTVDTNVAYLTKIEAMFTDIKNIIEPTKSAATPADIINTIKTALGTLESLTETVEPASTSDSTPAAMVAEPITAPTT